MTCGRQGDTGMFSFCLIKFQQNRNQIFSDFDHRVYGIGFGNESLNVGTGRYKVILIVCLAIFDIEDNLALHIDQYLKMDRKGKFF